MARDPYCRNCGYSLVGLTESSKCPECGLPIVEVLERGPVVYNGRRYKSEVQLFGLPLVHVALGPSDDGPVGKARGIIAIGDQAIGWVAIGALARGWLAIGGFAIGAVAIGGAGVGLIAVGGGAVGGIALGGGAVGAVAFGGGAAGGIATGGGAAGYLVQAGGGWGRHVAARNRLDPQAVAFFKRFNGLVGASPAAGQRFFTAVLAWVVLLAALLLAPAALLALAAYVRRKRVLRDR